MGVVKITSIIIIHVNGDVNFDKLVHENSVNANLVTYTQ